MKQWKILSLLLATCLSNLGFSSRYTGRTGFTGFLMPVQVASKKASNLPFKGTTHKRKFSENEADEAADVSKASAPKVRSRRVTVAKPSSANKATGFVKASASTAGGKSKRAKVQNKESITYRKFYFSRINEQGKRVINYENIAAYINKIERGEETFKLITRKRGENFLHQFGRDYPEIFSLIWNRIKRNRSLRDQFIEALNQKNKEGKTPLEVAPSKVQRFMKELKTVNVLARLSYNEDPLAFDINNVKAWDLSTWMCQ